MTISTPSTPRRFEADLFGLLLLQCYFLDYARPIVNAIVPASRGWPGAADWMHILAPVVLSVVFLKLFERVAARGAHVWQTLTMLLLCVMCVGRLRQSEPRSLRVILRRCSLPVRGLLRL